MAHGGINALHFSAAAIECLWKGEEEKQAFSGCMEGSIPLKASAPPPFYPGIQGGHIGPLAQGARPQWRPLYIQPCFYPIGTLEYIFRSQDTSSKTNSSEVSGKNTPFTVVIRTSPLQNRKIIGVILLALPSCVGPKLYTIR